jgi:LacI family transcriptional regulator
VRLTDLEQGRFRIPGFLVVEAGEAPEDRQDTASRMTIRMKDIAEELGLSQATISKVLRNHPDIGEETRQRVLNRVKELDYQPNSFARGLVTGRSFLIGLVAPSLQHPFFAEVAKSLANDIRVKGYSLIVSSSEEDPEIEREEVSRMLGHRLDALVIASTGSNIDQFERMENKGRPYVLIDREIPGLGANFVGIDDEKAGWMATDHLISMGCRRVAHIRGQDNNTGQGRLEGYKRALRDRGLPYSDTYVARGSSVDAEATPQGAEVMRRLLAQEPRPDGVFCFNDPMAIGAMSAILDAGLKIPDDIALIGCGNQPYDAFLRVPLSSIDQNCRIIGQRTAELVISLIEAKRQPRARTVILEPTLVARASSQRKPEVG